MRDVISDAELRDLVATTSPHCVSFYLPTHPAGPAVAEDPIHFKNLVVAARRELEQRGMRSTDIAALLAPAEAIGGDTAFWAHSDEGLAVFLGAGRLRRFRLPAAVADAAVVADRLWVAPLLPFVDRGERFHVLALSENRVRLLRGTRFGVTDLDLGDIPASSSDALAFDDRESQLHSHGASRVGAGEVSAAFHGQGVARDYDDVDETRFLRAVDRGLSGAGVDGADPLVLAGVERIVSRFRDVSRHGNLVESSIGGNPERRSPEELHLLALPLVAAHFDAGWTTVRDTFVSASTPTADAIADVIDAARSGRVAHLLVAAGIHLWTSDGQGGRGPDGRALPPPRRRRPDRHRHPGHARTRRHVLRRRRRRDAHRRAVGRGAAVLSGPAPMSGADIALLATLVALVATLFALAMIEASLLHVRRSAVAADADEGDPASTRLLLLLDDLPRVMNTVLLAVLLGQVTAASIAGVLARRWFGGSGITIATVVVTLILFIYGEAIPKTIAIADPVRHARRFSRPVGGLRTVLGPVVSVLVRIASWQSPGAGSSAAVSAVSEGELLHLTGEAAAAGRIDESDAELIEKSFAFGDLEVGEILIPIDAVVSVSTTTPVEVALRAAIDAGHRRLVVHQPGTTDHIAGFVRLRDLAAAASDNDGAVAGSRVRPALTVDPAARVIDVLREMQRTRRHLAVVAADNGVALGMVTVEDIVEVLLGEIDEPDPR